MYRARVIPCLLIRDRGLVKTRRFKDPVYVGDPVNAVRIFSEKEVDELVVLDIDASRRGTPPDFELVAEIAGECFMPVAYGGGITSLEQVQKLIRCGVEKVVVNSVATRNTSLITEASRVFGSQAIVAGVDVRRTLFGSYKVVAKSASVETDLNLEQHVRALAQAGAGEIFLNSVDRDGMMSGYDLELIRKVVGAVAVPVVACGGAGSVDHLVAAVKEGGASAASAGSFFVFQGKHRAVLISYPANLNFE